MAFRLGDPHLDEYVIDLLNRSVSEGDVIDEYNEAEEICEEEEGNLSDRSIEDLENDVSGIKPLYSDDLVYSDN